MVLYNSWSELHLRTIKLAEFSCAQNVYYAKMVAIQGCLTFTQIIKGLLVSWKHKVSFQKHQLFSGTFSSRRIKKERESFFPLNKTTMFYSRKIFFSFIFQIRNNTKRLNNQWQTHLKVCGIITLNDSLLGKFLAAVTEIINNSWCSLFTNPVSKVKAKIIDSVLLSNSLCKWVQMYDSGLRCN